MTPSLKRVALSARPRSNDKARFVREIERALLDDEVDLGVHSAKDLPTDLPEGLEIAGVLPREDPRDAYVGHVTSLGDVPEGSRIGTSSLRRRAQILALRPDLDVAEVRGNVDTRLDRLEAGDYDGLVLAAAGLRRLGRAEEIAFEIEPDQLAPAPGQGTIAIEARHSKDRPAAAAESVTDRGALATLLAERGWWRPSMRAATRPWGPSRRSSTGAACGSRRSAACRTAASGSATRSMRTTPIPRPSAVLSPNG